MKVSELSPGKGFMITVEVNSTLHQLEEGSGVLQLLEKLELNRREGVALCLNDEILSRSEWERTRLKQGDVLEIIQATQGG